ncbi:TRAP transporter substrate-binding protein [Pelistega europaea]|uniref:TRAP transporter substrate-binding protein n=1 Tax=Pelistega europaea TaxID=106147 RepID=A0A7Y4LAQ3_9BURK|nr:TRAP transporter substrate-binding protein [Pelistega europaea]NOL50058.1 TRAP transporter substrate-binding protein [Pelistega europaea]
MLGKKALLAGLAASVWATTAVAATTWDFPTAYPESNMHTQNIRAFADNVKKLTNGELVFNIHSNASLFKMPEIKRAIQTNQAQIGEFILTAYANEDPIFELDGVPFVASGYDAAWKLYQAQKPFLEKKLESQGMKLLFTVAWPPQGIFVNKELNSVDDLKGLKWRAYSPVTAKIAQLVGAQPVTIQQAELSQALATGAVNALMTSSATGYDIKINEFIKYFYDNEAWLPKNAVVVNKKVFDKLPEDQQKALLKAADEAEKAGWTLSREKTDFFKSSLEKSGLKIFKPSDTLQNGLVEKTKVMLDEWKKKAGTDGEKLLEAYQK